ncbi:MAG: hypothetical protein WEB00_05785 [Dehalococcoidia bacterium]
MYLKLLLALGLIALGLFEATADSQAGPPLCAGKEATIFGQSGTINGTTGNDVIVGSAANDVILGRGGNDTICASAGSDGLNGGAGNDKLYGQAGDDDLLGGAGTDVLSGGGGPDLCNGGGGTEKTIGCEVLTNLTIVATDFNFDMNQFNVRPNTTVRVALNNKTNGTPHNVAFYTDPAHTDLVANTALVPGPAVREISFLAPEEGVTYFYKCQQHAEMNGQMTTNNVFPP